MLLTSEMSAMQSGNIIGFIFVILIWLAIAFTFFYIFLYKTIYVKIIKRYLDIREREADAKIENLKKDRL